MTEFPLSVPPTFTKQADCKVKTNLGKIICECSGTGVPAPVVYWTKGTSKAIIGNGSVFEKSLASPDVDGKYNCHLKNLLREISSSYGLYYNSLFILTFSTLKSHIISSVIQISRFSMPLL